MLKRFAQLAVAKKAYDAWRRHRGRGRRRRFSLR